MRPSSSSTSCGPRATTSVWRSTRRWPSRLFAERRPELSIVELMISGGGLELCAPSGAAMGPHRCWRCRRSISPMRRLAAGASAFLAKPVVPLQFVSTVRDLLGSSALTRPVEGGHLLMDRLSTGNTRLDEVLGGGLVLGRDHAGGGRSGYRQDDPGRTMPVRERHSRTTGAVSVDGVGTVRQAVALRAGARVLRPDQARPVGVLRRSRRRRPP